MNSIRFGILGASRVARKSVLPALMATPDAKLAMIGSRDGALAAAVAQEAGCPAWGTYEDVLRSPEVDAVYISLPNSLHAEWTVKAARAGKHIWCEKPAASSYRDARIMVDAAKAANVRLMEGFMFLHHPQHEQVRAILASGKLGDIVAFSGSFSYPMPGPGNIRLSSELDGGAFLDACVYPIRASRFLLGEEPEEVACVLSVDEHTGVDTKATVLLLYPRGRSATAAAAFGGYYRSMYDVLGSTGFVRANRAYAVPPDMPVSLTVGMGDGERTIEVGPADQFQLLAKAFCREISLGDASTVRYEDELLAQAKVVNAALRAAHERRFVALSSVESDAANSVS